MVSKEGIPFPVEMERISRDMRAWCVQMFSSSRSSSPVAGASEDPRRVSLAEMSGRRELSSEEEVACVFGRSVMQDGFGEPDARLGRVDSRRAELPRAVDGAPVSCSQDDVEYEARVPVERQHSEKYSRAEKMYSASQAAGSKKNPVVTSWQRLDEDVYLKRAAPAHTEVSESMVSHRNQRSPECLAQTEVSRSNSFCFDRYHEPQRHRSQQRRLATVHRNLRGDAGYRHPSSHSEDHQHRSSEGVRRGAPEEPNHHHPPLNNGGHRQVQPAGGRDRREEDTEKKEYSRRQSCSGGGADPPSNGDSGDDDSAHRRSRRRRDRRRWGDRRVHRDDSSPSSDGSPEQSAYRSRPIDQKRWMKPEKFDGKTSFETFLYQFENCVQYNNWNERDKVAHLRWSLTGIAAQLLWGTEHLDYEQLVEKLRARFGGSGMEERFQNELRCRRRARGESLRELAQDIRRLMALAYPGEKSSLAEHIARDAFLSALDDPEFELKIREREPTDLDAAVKLALRFEVFRSAMEQSSSRHRVNRHVT